MSTYRKCGFYWNIEKYVSADLNCPKCNDSEIDDVGERIILQCNRGKRGRSGHGWDK